MSEVSYKYIFGPVPSRRLGRSLGISPIPSKICNYTCIYCQLGRTTHFTNKREMFFPPEAIIAEVRNALKQDFNIDYITIVGDGEPTLYEGLGLLIKGIKKFTEIPVAVITNGALLYDREVREDLKEADVVLPTLDAANQELFKKINRPRRELEFGKIIEGMKEFRKIYPKQIWMEVMLIKDLNDSPEILTDIKKLLDEIKPDRVYINVPIRPPAEGWVEIPPTDRLQTAIQILNAENIAHYEELLVETVNKEASSEQIILEITQRHPLRDDQIFSLFPELKEEEVQTLLEDLEEKKLIKPVFYNKKKFWQIVKEKKRD
ncbi:MAG: radical SAM protein [Candidatus Heimdallarchaeaceae archaeon]